MAETVHAIGLMSGTSYDGVDAALIESDGEALMRPGPAITAPYPADIRGLIREAIAAGPDWNRGAAAPEAITAAAKAITDAHIEAVKALLERAQLDRKAVHVIGFHGQTVLHRPDLKRTEQIGEPQRLATETGIPVVFDLRQEDIAAGGQGAPLVPAFHQALVAGLGLAGEELPVAVVNLGGVGNVTWIGPGEEMLAFDIGPANAPLNDWVERATGAGMDAFGRLAASGKADHARLQEILQHPFYARTPPKSLDRDDFTAALAEGLSLEDGAATLTELAALSAAAAKQHMPVPPTRWIICGGGRLNETMMAGLRRHLNVPVAAAEDVGWRGDFLEAEAFAYLAVRSLRGLPVTFPQTTGVAAPLPGGRLYTPKP